MKASLFIIINIIKNIDMHKIIIIPLFVALFVQCKNDEPENEDIYNLKTVITTDYNSDTISIGDTLWFESEVVGFLVDSATQKNIYFGEALLNINVLIRAWNIDNQEYQPDCYSFDLRTYAGYISYTKKTTMLNVYYYLKEGKYLMKFGVVFNKPGIYSIDGDYLAFKNYYNNEIINFGGGVIKYYNLDNEYKEAYLYSVLNVDNRNLNLYNNLSKEDKESFQDVNEVNESRYFFIKVNGED